MFLYIFSQQSHATFGHCPPMLRLPALIAESVPERPSSARSNCVVDFCIQKYATRHFSLCVLRALCERFLSQTQVSGFPGRLRAPARAGCVHLWDLPFPLPRLLIADHCFGRIIRPENYPESYGVVLGGRKVESL